MTETLYVVACVANPLLWQTRSALARAAILDWLREPNVHVTLAECAYGSRGYQLSDLAGARVTHVPLRATTMAWSKECLINRAISTLPPDALKIAALDADVTFRQAGWATKTLNALDLYEVIQPWVTAYDLGPNDEHLAAHASFASVYHSGKPVVASGAKFWAFNGGPTPTRIRATPGRGSANCSIASAACSNTGAWARATITWRWGWSGRSTLLCPAA